MKKKKQTNIGSTVPMELCNLILSLKTTRDGVWGGGMEGEYKSVFVLVVWVPY